MIDKNNSCSTIRFEKRMDEYDIVFGTANDKPKSVIRISLCRTAKRNPLMFARHGHNLMGESPERAPIAGSA